MEVITNHLLQAALDYHKRGWNVLPVSGKSPTVSGWKKWQSEKQELGDINRLESYWNEATGIAVVCGSVSGNLLIIDLDGQEAIDLFYNQFPHLTKTYTVKTGRGLHLYYYQHDKFITDTKAFHKILVGNGEICVRVQNCYCVAPPSIHPDGGMYAVQSNWAIKRTSMLGQVVRWINRQDEKEKETESPDAPAMPAAQSPASSSPKVDQQSKDQKWALAALDSEVARVRSAGTGERNSVLYDASLKLGSIIAAGLLNQTEVEQELVSAASVNGLLKEDGSTQVKKTIESGISAGLKNPRQPSQQIAPKKNGNMTKAIEQQARTKLDEKPDTDEDTHPLPYRPDEEQIATYVKSQLKGDFHFFRSSWHEYKDGVWISIKNIDKQLTDVLKAVRMRGVKVTRNKVSGVDFFLQTYQELEDDSVVDNYPQYINVKNGLFNLDTMKLEPHRKDAYITAQANFNFDGSAKPTVFVNWLNSMLVKPDGSFDRELMMLVQEAMGYSLTSDTRHRVSFWVKGPTHSGKSTLLKTLIMLMGSHHETLDLNQLGTNRFLLARIAGKRLVTFGESDAQTKLADGMYKMLVDNGGEITADIKNREPISFVPQCKVWWAMNNYPYVGDRSGAVHSRVMIIPFHRSIPQHEWDLELSDKLESELPGIFNFALKGLERLREQKRFTYVSQSEALKEELQRDTDVYSAFYDDEQWCSKTGQTEPMILYKAFDVWCKDNGIRNYASNVSIKREWMRIGMEYGRTGPKGRFYEGISLTTFAKNKIL